MFFYHILCANPLGIDVYKRQDLYTRDFAFDHYQLKECRFEVRKENKSVVNYHRMFNPTLLKEDEQNYYFSLTKANYEIFKNKILKLY